MITARHTPNTGAALPDPTPTLLGAGEFCATWVLPGRVVQRSVLPRSAVITAPIFRERALKARAMGQSPAIVRALENQAQNAPASAADIRSGQDVRVDLIAASLLGYLPLEAGPGRQTYADVRVMNTSGTCSVGTLGHFPAEIEVTRFGPDNSTTPLPGGGESYASLPVYDPELLRAAQAAQAAYHKMEPELAILNQQIAALRAQPQMWVQLQSLEARRSALMGARENLSAQFSSLWVPIDENIITSPPATGALTTFFLPGQTVRLHRTTVQQARKFVPDPPFPILVFRVARDTGPTVIVDLVALSTGMTTKGFQGGRYVLPKIARVFGSQARVTPADLFRLGSYYRSQNQRPVAERYEAMAVQLGRMRT